MKGIENMISDKKITVFTPAYNRASSIGSLYNSLQKQSMRDFEWLIIDDGSTDETEQTVQGWINENNDFPIRYYRQENHGKCSAINRGLHFAEGQLFYIVDSDDYLTEDALEKIVRWERDLPEGELFCGVAGNMGTGPDSTVNSLFDSDYFEGTLLDRYGKVDGERSIAFYTDVHRRYEYPIFENEKFMTEAVTYNRMAHDGYKIRFYNDIICIYEYLEDGLTRAGRKLFLENPRGFGLWLQEKSRFTGDSLKQKYRMYYTFTCDLSAKFKPAEIAEYISAPRWFVYFIWYSRKLIGK